MSEPFVPNMNCANFIIPYPEEIATRTGSSGMVFSIRELYLRAAADVDDKEPELAAFLREVANCYPDVDRGELVERDSRGNLVFEEDDWDGLTVEQKLHRGNTNAAIAMVDRIRYQLENAQFDNSTAEDVTRVRRQLAEISM